MGFHINDIGIILTDGRHKYQTGDYVNGKVIISVNGELQISVLTIRLSCVAEVKWVELPGFKSQGHNVHIRRKYLDYGYQLPDHYSGQYLNDGVNEIPFVFKIPESDLPSTFEGLHGSIYYVIEAFVGEPEIDESARTEARIQVEAPFRDNLFLSVGGSVEKELSILNLGSGIIKMHANIMKKGYYPGETIEIVCDIQNDSTADVKPRASLYQTQIYMSGDRHKTIESQVTEYALGEEVLYEMNALSVIRLRIPDTAPLSIKCSNITVKFFVHVTLDIPYAADLHLNLPIIITNSFALSRD